MSFEQDLFGGSWSASGTSTLHPWITLWINDEDITGRLDTRLIEATLRDVRGMEADQLSLTLDDTDGRMQIPNKGAKMRLALGWRGKMVDKGVFIVDDVRHEGPPDRLMLTARSADFGGQFKAAKERSFHGETLGTLLEWIASDYELVPAVDKTLAQTKIDHIDQTNESDANFLTRLAQRYDATCTIKAEKLLFIPKGRGKTASGTPIPVVTIKRSDGDSHRYQEADRESKFTGCKALFDDIMDGKRKHVVVGTEECLRTLRDPYPTEAEAKSAAESEMGRTQRAAASMSLTLARGRPELIPETPIRLVGWKPQITNHKWIIGDLTHKIGSGGLTTDLELEVQLEDD